MGIVEQRGSVCVCVLWGSWSRGVGGTLNTHADANAKCSGEGERGHDLGAEDAEGVDIPRADQPAVLAGEGEGDGRERGGGSALSGQHEG